MSNIEETKLTKKQARIQQRNNAAQNNVAKLRENAAEEEDYSKDLYGKKINDCEVKVLYTNVSDINTSVEGKVINLRGYLQNSRKTGKQIFFTLRQLLSSVQCIAFRDETISGEMIKFINSINRESFVEVQGVVSKVDKPIQSCTQSNFEIKVTRFFLVSNITPHLPLQVEDAMRPESSDLVKVNLDTKLDNRVLDLRTPVNMCIFKIKSLVKFEFQSFLLKKEFFEVDVPKIIAGASEGGAEVFKVKYFDIDASLAQSPQLYKQMLICAGWEKVMTIGPVYRAENSNTHRHLCEFIGLDLEMSFNQTYHEVVNVICETFIHIFETIEEKCSKELEIIKSQYGFEPFCYLKPTLILEFAEGVKMLQNAGVEMSKYEDLSTANEKLLGKLVKQKYGTDFYVLDKFPSAVRPFYTMYDPVDPLVSNSYDMFIRGEEILSGAQRINDPELLTERAKIHNIDLSTIKEYIDSIGYSCPPHAGGGIGLERVVMLYLGLDNIRRTTAFPRDPKRFRP